MREWAGGDLDDDVGFLLAIVSFTNKCSVNYIIARQVNQDKSLTHRLIGQPLLLDFT